ncbi:MAG: Glu/Leu/Phe/Val dehydrogenase [Alphaproteobacteria bacterium]|nr:Glu/Leu/Phe/Val dehydrogenase [Alphaproteobacteria bacterium]
MDKATFEAELADLKKRFDALAPELEVTVRDPSLGLEGYIVVYNTGISLGGPLHYSGKGGTRVTPTVSLDEIRMLAKRMALKNAAAGLPMGGAKSGLKAVSDAPDSERTYRRFVTLCKPYLRENGGPFGGFGFDIGGRPEHPVWACDELKSTQCFTGKPLSMGGTDYDREGIAGLGVAVAAKAALEHAGKSVQGTPFAVQGAGAMGAAIIRYFSEYGGKLVAVSDPRLGGTWSIHTPSQPLVQALSHGAFDEAKSLLNASGAHHNENPAAVLSAPCTVLFPAALQDVIDDTNVNTLQCAYVVEGANNPTSRTAQQALYARGVTLVPDFIANPGGIIAAYVELTSKVSVEENARTRAKAEEAKQLTRDRIAANVKTMLDMAQNLGVEPYEAALYIALKKIVTWKDR